ncbi:stage II sporulation protein E [Streptomyces sp. 3211.6]|uniref:PP2C family protein-serine/threonine phosphatase n=1 Tax=Streptomyces TaxID=1883 RepID=UPI0009A486DF|nr:MULTISPECIES: PP2C family protein-serine/threonine phosphatase [Streptomyces]RKT03761.1 stage II sporulation protein E [Streptomyces sp. 3211.6]RPF39631.1 stage II sporulation protein E [Streptomyces sp. Ag109_G2-6]
MITRREMHRARLGCVLAWGGAAVSWELSTPGPLGPSLATCAAFLVLATGCALHIRRGLVAELRRSREIAGATQRVLLRPLPGRIDGLALCAAQLSASRGAAVGGDLYEAVPTAYGVRVVIGDVRGHGLAALGAAAAVLGSFREAAYDEPSLGGVLLRMERSLHRYLRERARAEHPSACPADPESPVAEDFVTVLLLQIAPDNTVLALNCGHPWPYLLRRAPVPQPCGAASSGGRGSKGGAGSGSAQRHAEARVLDGGDPWPPLGVLPVPPGVQPEELGQLHPGEALLLHTDGAEDARDRHGRFFPLARFLAAQQTLTPARLVAGVHAALLRHTGGRLADDVALLALRNDRT